MSLLEAASALTADGPTLKPVIEPGDGGATLLFAFLSSHGISGSFSA